MLPVLWRPGMMLAQKRLEDGMRTVGLAHESYWKLGLGSRQVLKMCFFLIVHVFTFFNKKIFKTCCCRHEKMAQWPGIYWLVTPLLFLQICVALLPTVLNPRCKSRVSPTGHCASPHRVTAEIRKLIPRLLYLSHAWYWFENLLLGIVTTPKSSLGEEKFIKQITPLHIWTEAGLAIEH